MLGKEYNVANKLCYDGQWIAGKRHGPPVVNSGILDRLMELK